jgi:hypothetical protein
VGGAGGWLVLVVGVEAVVLVAVVVLVLVVQQAWGFGLGRAGCSCRPPLPLLHACPSLSTPTHMHTQSAHSRPTTQPTARSIHRFFEALGPEEVSRRHNSDDKPYRMVSLPFCLPFCRLAHRGGPAVRPCTTAATAHSPLTHPTHLNPTHLEPDSPPHPPQVKTILHEVVKHCGPDTLRLVPPQVHQDAAGPPVLVAYINNYLQTHTAMRQVQGGGAAAAAAAALQAAAQPRAAPGALSRCAPRRCCCGARLPACLPCLPCLVAQGVAPAQARHPPASAHHAHHTPRTPHATHTTHRTHHTPRTPHATHTTRHAHHTPHTPHATHTTHHAHHTPHSCPKVLQHDPQLQRQRAARRRAVRRRAPAAVPRSARAPAAAAAAAAAAAGAGCRGRIRAAGAGGAVQAHRRQARGWPPGWGGAGLEPPSLWARFSAPQACL